MCQNIVPQYGTIKKWLDFLKIISHTRTFAIAPAVATNNITMTSFITAVCLNPCSCYEVHQDEENNSSNAYTKGNEKNMDKKKMIFLFLCSDRCRKMRVWRQEDTQYIYFFPIFFSLSDLCGFCH